MLWLGARTYRFSESIKVNRHQRHNQPCIHQRSNVGEKRTRWWHFEQGALRPTQRHQQAECLVGCLWSSIAASDGLAIGLTKDDISLGSATPSIWIKAHPWRPLKTHNSGERYVPAVGSTLRGLKRAYESSQSKFLFPRYCSADGNKSDYASNGLNKWLRPMVPKGCVIHSFRHSFRDRLRAVQCPSDIIDQLGGWKTAGVGQGYGEGYPLEVLNGWPEKIII